MPRFFLDLTSPPGIQRPNTANKPELKRQHHVVYRDRSSVSMFGVCGRFRIYGRSYKHPPMCQPASFRAARVFPGLFVRAVRTPAAPRRRPLPVKDSVPDPLLTHQSASGVLYADPCSALETFKDDARCTARQRRSLVKDAPSPSFRPSGPGSHLYIWSNTTLCLVYSLASHIILYIASPCTNSRHLHPLDTTTQWLRRASQKKFQKTSQRSGITTLPLTPTHYQKTFDA